MSDDPAPSPSIPDPSDERAAFAKSIAAYVMTHPKAGEFTPEQAAAETVGVLFSDDRAHDQFQRLTAAARPTPLPEAREPLPLAADLDLPEHWSAIEKVAYRSGWSDARLRALNAASTPSAPSVAVDPEAGAGALGWKPTRNYLNVERCPQTLGDAMRLIGRYTESEGGNSPETRQARTDLFDAYETWCQLDRPETEAPPLTGAQRARFEAAAERALAANRALPAAASGGDGEGTGNDG